MKSRAVLRTSLQQAVSSQVKLQSGSVYLTAAGVSLVALAALYFLGSITQLWNGEWVKD